MEHAIHPHSTLPLPSVRTEHRLVCPPEAQPALARLAAELRRWLASSGADAAARVPAAAARTLQALRDDFVDALHDVPGEAATRIVHRALATQAMRELWHLRVDVFALVAREHGEQVAEQRLARLNRHFPTRSPRSGFAGLDGAPR
jgi:hypothetical protein